MKKLILVALVAATVTGSAAGGTSSAAVAAKKFLTYVNAKMKTESGGTTLNHSYVGNASCTLTAFPTWGKPAVKGATYYCVGQVVNAQGVSLGLGARDLYEVESLTGGGWRFLTIAPECAPPHFCNPADSNVGGALTPG